MKSQPTASQVKIESSVPARITAIKPKFWLTSSISIAAKHAGKLPVT